jgi:hypothetical protein
MQTSPYHPAFVAYQGGGLGDLGAFGLDPTAGKVASSAGAYAAGAGATAGAAAMGAGGYAAIGSVAGPIGAVVGLVVGIVLTKLLTKNYLNVGQMNAAEAAEIAAFNQYRTIAGQAPGRQFGLAAMRAVWKGALHSGFFPGNQETQCFHDGCSAHPGNASLIDIAIDGGSRDKNTFPDLLPQFMSRVSSPVRNIQPLPPFAARSTLAARPSGRIAGFRGFGALGQSGFPGTPEAVVFVDSFFIPANSSGAPCGGHPCYWAAPQNATEHQILYDVADAYLAQQSFPSTPFIAKQAALTSQQAPAAILPAGSSVPGGVPLISVRNPFVNPLVTPMLPVTPPAVAVGSGVVTTGNAATAANLDAALSANGYRRIGTSQDGYPIYQASAACPQVLYGTCPPGATFVYANGQLYPYASAAQVAVTGSAGTGITTPAGGIDPATAALIANMLSQGATPAVAAHAASSKLQAQGVPVTPDVQAQLDYTAAQGVTAPATVSPLLLLVGAGVLVVMLGRRNPSTKGPLQ